MFNLIKKNPYFKLTFASIGFILNISFSRTLSRWVKIFREEGVEGLSKKTRSDNNKRRKVSAKIRKLIEGLALEGNKSVATIHRKSCEVAKKLGEFQPSYAVAYSIIKSIPKSMLSLAQGGNKQYEQKYELLCMDNVSRANEVWQSDHCLLDIDLKYKDGTQKPWLTVITDSYSRAIAGYYLSFDAPSSIRVALSLRQAIWSKQEKNWIICGIPEKFYTDNGTDFKSDHIASVCTDLKIQTIFSIPGKPRGRGKIERFFLTLNQRLLCELPGYVKNKTDKRPLITIEELDEQLKNFVLNIYHSEPHSSTKESPIKRWNNKYSRGFK